ncbi:MAG TPA: SDR family oxidoreductase [Marivita sp.]|nr:SDR family oxidoreductase [Marivita sp.]
MKKTALITGASSGIGLELARYHASKGGDVILAARRESALTDLKADLEDKHGVAAHVVVADLASPGGAQKLYDDVTSAGLSVDYLINNAGLGGHGKLIDRALSDEMSMIDLNVKALVDLTHRFASDMVTRGGGKILNVGSTAGFAPGPNQAVYFATKAFVNSFSQAIDHEFRPKGVTSTVLAPGYVKTEFAEVAKLEGTKLVKQGGATAASVAKVGYEAMLQGKLVVINEAKLSVLMNWVIPFLPRRMVLKTMSDMQEK